MDILPNSRNKYTAINYDIFMLNNELKQKLTNTYKINNLRYIIHHLKKYHNDYEVYENYNGCDIFIHNIGLIINIETQENYYKTFENIDNNILNIINDNVDVEFIINWFDIKLSNTINYDIYHEDNMFVHNGMCFGTDIKTTDMIEFANEEDEVKPNNSIEERLIKVDNSLLDYDRNKFDDKLSKLLNHNYDSIKPVRIPSTARHIPFESHKSIIEE